MRFPLIKRDPLLQTKLLGQALRLFIEQYEEEIDERFPRATPQESRRTLASFTYLF